MPGQAHAFYEASAAHWSCRTVGQQDNRFKLLVESRGKSYQTLLDKDISLRPTFRMDCRPSADSAEG